ncbi:pectin acetylesterase 11-like [Salvia splendens]|uniref:pectin acetylesterase 11-like n=1 Tax=Salvia splendens TaxID=180675 RepID=UPI001C280070|nr:pectin acetylesterase 11-like [Salvia splendens]XP_042055874.1 pectin acetylesterase 11-like [Salvia splendens]XP_042055875.1 pectin acetylesterase 11-like [Salvia splendens]
MATLLVALLTILSLVVVGIEAGQNVIISLLDSAIAKGAVCLDGTPPAYAYRPGFGDGVDNWHIFLEGGAWCQNVDECLTRTKIPSGSSAKLISTKNGSVPFSGMLANNSTFNPDFYNWHVFKIFYCDGSSFMSDVEDVDPKHNLTYRGARIYDAMMDELLRIGMGNAKNALLSGISAGGLATILHCDKFQSLFHKTTRVKCLSDSGFFIHGEHFIGGDLRESFFSGVVSTHGLTNTLPTSCTFKFSPTLCLFPENLVPDVQTPLFLIESSFDSYQISQTLFKDKSPSWISCNQNLMTCNLTEIEIMKDFRFTIINTLKSTIASSSSKRGYFVHSCYLHGHMEYKGGSTCSSFIGNGLANKTIALAVGDWYFDRSEFQEMDMLNNLPRNCTSTDDYPTFEKKCSDYYIQHHQKP